MDYKYEDIEKIIDFKTWTDKQKLDELFRIDSDMYTKLGVDSTKKEREEVKRKSRKIYLAVKKIDKRTGEQCLNYMDR